MSGRIVTCALCTCSYTQSIVFCTGWSPTYVSFFICLKPGKINFHKVKFVMYITNLKKKKETVGYKFGLLDKLSFNMYVYMYKHYFGF